MKIRQLDFEIRGASSLIGKIIPMSEWAEKMQIPDRTTGRPLTGERIEQILGVRSKSWDPELFANPNTIMKVGHAALDSAEISPEEIDALILVTCTPFELNLGQDGFRFARDLGLRDDVAPLQLEAGCGGLARAVEVASQLKWQNALVLAYNVGSPGAEKDGTLSPLYKNNDIHPFGQILWASAGIFSDGAGALVLSRAEGAAGVSFYSRDQKSFGDAPGFKDPIVHYPGGGLLHPIGVGRNDALMCYAMSGKIIAEYYNKGMVLNHETLMSLRPNYVDEVRRIYTHQAGPAMVRSFVDLAKLPRTKVPTNAADLGNLVSPCTIKLLHDDLVSGDVIDGDEVCFSVVGAGPERGAFTLKNKIRRIVRLEDL